MSNSERQQFSSPDWRMEVAADAGLNGSGSYHADVFRLGTFVCRIALARQFTDHAAAEAALAVRVQEWLNDYEARLGAKDTGASDSPAPSRLAKEHPMSSNHTEPNVAIEATPTIDDALEQNKQVTEEIKVAADELGLVHAVLDKQIPGDVHHGDVADAVARTDELEKRLSKSTEALDEVNETLERVADAQSRPDEQSLAPGQAAKPAPGLASGP